MPSQYVVDTTVLQKANALITAPPGRNSLFARRIRLLDDIRQGQKTVLYSRRLLAEYERQVRTPRNDFVRLFFERLARPGGAVYNWANWPSRDREKARECRYPQEDDHVLRTAISDRPTTIVSEEGRMVQAGACIYRHFRVHIVGL